MALPTAELKSFGVQLGFQTVGVAEAGPAATADAYEVWLRAGFQGEMTYLSRHLAAKRHPEELLPGVRSVIACALNYNQPNPPQIGQPRIARYALGRDYHKVTRAKLRVMERWLAASHSESRFQICVDSAPLLEREYANRAGLGWFGKNTCLIDSKRGSWFVIGFLLTTLEFEPDAPAIGGCGTCQKCIAACPTGAIVQLDGRWTVDSRSCISYLTIEKRGPFEPSDTGRVGEWTFGCDVCQEVCPFNEPKSTQPLRATVTNEPDFLGVRRWPNLIELAQITEPDWDVLTRGSPVRRAGRDGLQRTALANLENQA